LERLFAEDDAVRGETPRPGEQEQAVAADFPFLTRNLSRHSCRARGALAFGSEQRVDTPVTTALRGHVEEDETEQDGGHALILNRPRAMRRMKLPTKGNLR